MARRFPLPDAELSWRFSRSSGPGGQHVNTADTRVELSWSLEESRALDETQKERLRQALRSRLAGGRLTVRASRYRSQHRNREEARARLEGLIAQALAPAATRRATRPSRAAAERRLGTKRRRAEIKRLRRPPE